MIKEVYWTPLAKESFLKISSFISQHWSEKALSRFEDLVDDRILQISNNPELAPKIHKSGLRKLVIHKNVSLFYDLPSNYLRILILWDNRMNPKELKNKLNLE